jgi:hypothetical protein
MKKINNPKDQKKFVNYRISPVSIEKLNSVAAELGWSKTRVIEELVRRYIPELVNQEAIRITETAAKYRTDAEERKQGGTK